MNSASGDHVITGDTDVRSTASGTSGDHVVTRDPSVRNSTQSEPTPKDLLRQIDLARSALAAQLDALRAGGTTNLHKDMADNASASLLKLNLLADQLVGGAKDVTALRAEISSAITAGLAYTSQISSAVSATQTPEQAAKAALQEASNAAHQSVIDFQRDFYGRRIFDPYLQFASASDEEAYRRREAERQQAIDKALAENTPEGNLRATNLSIEQLRDAGAHGADRSPDFKPGLDKLMASNDALTSAISAKGAVPTQQTALTGTSASDDPLTKVQAKPTDPKGVAAVLLAAGISGPHADNVGPGVDDRSAARSSVTRTT